MADAAQPDAALPRDRAGRLPQGRGAERALDAVRGARRDGCRRARTRGGAVPAARGLSGRRVPHALARLLLLALERRVSYRSARPKSTHTRPSPTLGGRPRVHSRGRVQGTECNEPNNESPYSSSTITVTTVSFSARFWSPPATGCTRRRTARRPSAWCGAGSRMSCSWTCACREWTGGRLRA